MTFTVLAKLWNQFSFTDPQDIQDLLRLTQSTLRAACCARHIPDRWLLRPSQEFRDIILVCLGDAMSQAVTRIKATKTSDDPDVQARGVEILSQLVAIINDEIRTRPTPKDIWDKAEIMYWKDLQRNFEQKIDSLCQLLRNQALAPADVQVESSTSSCFAPH
ncbi:hypothetical protein C8R44DRAFT_810927 [Mycena epipterygia]|nr:hypothetical protein C8R44DRAFT_810927 [Mycena epipterygia]